MATSKTSNPAEKPEVVAHTAERKRVPVQDDAKAEEAKNQAIRDAHFLENGVKADGTGGTVPESE